MAGNENASESSMNEEDAVNEATSDINDDPEVDLVEEYGVVNIGHINESADLPVKDAKDADIDARSDT